MSSAVVSSDTIEIQAPSVAYYFKVGAELKNDFCGEKFTIHEMGYPEESIMKGSTVIAIGNIVI